MKSSQLQSLSRRVKNAIAAIHVEIRWEADSLTGDTEIDKRTYSTLSRLQRERKKLEALQIGLKRDLAAAFREEHACRILAQHGIYNLIVIADDNHIIADDGGLYTEAEWEAAMAEGE